jgi:hypothetical protein
MSAKTTESQRRVDARAQRDLGAPRQAPGEDPQSIERVWRLKHMCVVEHQSERRRSLEQPDEPRKSNPRVAKPILRAWARRRRAGGVDGPDGVDNRRGQLPHLVVARLERYPREWSLIDR